MGAASLLLSPILALAVALEVTLVAYGAVPAWNRSGSSGPQEEP